VRIFYIGKFRHSYNTERYVQWALEQEGVEVHQWTCNPHNGRRDKERRGLGLQTLIDRVEYLEPDVILFSKFAPLCTSDLLSWCRQRGILTVCWLWDLYWGYRSRKPAQFHADLLFTTDGGHNQRFSRYNHRVLRQGIHALEHVICPSEPVRDVAFVGGLFGHPKRARLLSWLQNTYRGRFKHYMHTRGLALNKALARVKVVVGDSYPSPNYWSNRIYEILGRGGFLLHPETIGLDEEFIAGKHYVDYKRPGNRAGWQALQGLIDYWVTHDKEREQIRQAPVCKFLQRCRAHHVAALCGHRGIRFVDVVQVFPCLTNHTRNVRQLQLDRDGQHNVWYRPANAVCELHADYIATVAQVGFVDWNASTFP